MPSPIQHEIDNILRKHLRWDFDGRLDDLEQIFAYEDITKEEQIKIKILQSDVHSKMFNFGDEIGSKEISLKLAQEALEESKELGDNFLMAASIMRLSGLHFDDNKWQEYQDGIKESIKLFEKIAPRTDLSYLVLKALILINRGNLPFIEVYIGGTPTDEEKEESFQLWIDGEKFSEKNNFPSMQTGFLVNLLTIYVTKGELDLALETAEKIVSVAKEKGSKRLIIWALSRLAWTYRDRGDYKKYYEISKERIKICEEVNLQLPIAYGYWNLALYHILNGEYDEALEYLERASEIQKDYKRKIPEAGLKRMRGYIYLHKGELDKATELYNQAFPVFEEEQPQGWFSIFSDLVDLSIQKGDLDKALEFLKQLAPMYEKRENQFGISGVLTKEGLIYWQKGMQEQALTSIQEGFEIRQKIGHKNLIANSLSYLIQFSVELNNLEAARKYFETLEIINKEVKEKEVNQSCKYSEALILKRSSDLRDRMKAEVLFDQLLEDDISYSVMIQVLLNLCDLLILEMKETDDPKVLEKIYNHLNKLQEMVEKNKSHLLHAETIRLNAQLALLEFDVDKARSLLLQALNIAQENKFDRLVLDILQQQEKLTKQSIELRNLEKTTSTISQRMSVIDLNGTVSSIKKTSITETVKKDEEVSKKLFSIQI